MENKQTIRWQMHEFEYKHKTVDWFWALWIIAIALMAIFAIYNNIIGAILVFVSTFTLSLQATQRPEVIDFELNERVLMINDKKILLRNIDSFDIQEHEDREFLLLKHKMPVPYTIIPINKDDAEDIEKMLISKMERHEHELPIYHKLAKYF